MFRATRFLIVIAFGSAMLPSAVSYAEGVADTSPYVSAGPHVVDRWFLEPSPSPLDIEQGYLDAVDRGDITGAAAAFSINAMYHGGGCQPDPCVGADAIENEILRVVAIRAHTTIRTANADGNQLTWSGLLDSDAIRAEGFDHLTTAGTVRVDGDAIVDYRVWLDMADPVTGMYVQQLELAYQRAPAAPSPDTKHALD